jgi:CxxC motif-containing protein (DUF1111 family)
LNGVPFHPYRDFLWHDTGALGDGLEQGQASGTAMRARPLWGLRVRETFLHAGRTRSLAEAIQAHAGQGQAASAAFGRLSGPEGQQRLACRPSL